MRIIKLNEGIKYNSDTDSFMINFNCDTDSDVIHLCKPEIYQCTFLENTYYFGYKFITESSQTRSKFIYWLKGLYKNCPTKFEYEQIICKPLKLLDKTVGLKNFKCFVYPKSDMSMLVSNMIDYCEDMCQHNTLGIPIELLKNIPNKIDFDWIRFYNDCEKNKIDEHSVSQMEQHIKDVLLPGIHSLDYFSIARNVKPKYRKYILNYLTLNDEDTNVLKSLTANDKILIIDDINTTGSTMKEIIRIIKNINIESEIYIFTLIGNHM